MGVSRDRVKLSFPLEKKNISGGRKNTGISHAVSVSYLLINNVLNATF